MTINEHARAQWQAMKNKTPEQRKAYFKQYYATPALCLVAMLVVIGLFLGTVLTNNEPGFYNIFMNSYPADTCQAYLDEFGTAQGINIKKNPVYGDSSIYVSDDPQIEERESLEMLAALIAGGTVDTLSAPLDLFTGTAYSEYFMDLRLVLDEATLEKYADRLVYVDATVMEQVLTDISTAPAEVPDALVPEEMDKPIPVGILLDKEGAFAKNVRFLGADPAIGISITTPRLELSRTFLLHVLEDAQN